MRKAYVDGPFGQIHFLDGQEGRPLVLLHQAIMTANQFDRVFAPLRHHGLRPIAIDMPGFGQSDRTPEPATIADYAAAVLPVLDGLGIARAAVGGHHTGALVSGEVALRHPDRVSAVVLGGPFLPTPLERAALSADILERERAFEALPDAAHMVAVAQVRQRYAGDSIGPDRISDYVVQAIAAYAQGTYWYGHNAAFAYDQEGPLRDLSQPTLILTNTGDMLYDQAQKARAMRPDFAYAELQGGGIDIVDQDPQGWADAIARFLQSVPA